MKTILVTGRNGFVGRALVRQLKNKYRVVSLVRSIKKDIDYSKEELIISNIQMLKEADIKKHNIELIIHLAASIRGTARSLLENNINSAESIFKIAEKFNIPVIHLSSTNVIFCDYLGTYALSKKIGEDLLKESKINYLILRVPLIIGKDSPSAKAVRNFYQKLFFFPLFGRQEGKVQPIHISTLVDKIIEKVGEGIYPHKTINIVGVNSYTYQEILRCILSGRKKQHFIRIPFLLAKLITVFLEKINIPFFISFEEIKSVNMDKIIKPDFDGLTEFVNNDKQVLFA